MKSTHGAILPPAPLSILDRQAGPLEQKIRQHIGLAGPLTFAHFMEMALYDPEWGYYQRQPVKVGLRGDYMTSPELGPLFGQLMAVQVADVWRQIGRPREFEVLEYGAGRGTLCLSLLDFLRDRIPECFQAVRYLLVESSPAMQEELGRLISGCNVSAGKVSLAGNADRKLDSNCARLVLANEFLDALPVHWVIRRAEGLREKYVAFEGGVFTGIEGEPSTPEIIDYLRWAGVKLAEGQEATINLNALRWLEMVARGPAVTAVWILDYGHLAEELYSGPGRSNSIACYFRHTVNFEPLQRVGSQDITSHVDFSALRQRAVELGFSVCGYLSQSSFLTNLSLAASAYLDWESNLDRRLNLKELVHPEGMGSTFKVLVLKGSDTPFT